MDGPATYETLVSRQRRVTSCVTTVKQTHTQPYTSVDARQAGYAVGGPALDRDRKRLRRHLPGDVQVSESASQHGHHPGPLLAVDPDDRLGDERHSSAKGRTSTLPRQGLQALDGQPQRHVEVGSLDDPEAADVFLRFQIAVPPYPVRPQASGIAVARRYAHHPVQTVAMFLIRIE